MSLRFTDKNKFRLWLIIFLVVTLLALMNYNRFVMGELAEGKPGKYLFYFIMETTGAYTILLLVPLVIKFISRFPIQRHNLATKLPLHLLATMVFGTSHTLLMYLSRVIIFWIFKMGVYNYGIFKYRFPMEYSHQFLTYWTIYAVSVLLNSIREVQEQKLRTTQLQQQLTRARLQALQMQLHPHFLFNTLNMISSTMYDDVKAADKMMANLSDLLRITLNTTNGQKHPLEKELEITGLYIEIMKARYRDKLSITMHIDENTHDALVPGFILQPLVENAIKFGMENLKSVSVALSSQKKGSTLKITIQDNGPGISGDSKEIIKNGVGLSNTVERLEKLYGADHTFHLRNIDDGGLRVVIEIPYQKAS